MLLVGALTLFAPLFHSRGGFTGSWWTVTNPPRQQQLSAAQSKLPMRAGADAQRAKANLMALLDDPSVQKEVLRPEGKPTRGRVDEAILMLERVNPTDEPVYSTLLDGTWKVKYSGSFAPGLLSSPTRELALFLYGGGFSLGNALSSFAGGFWGDALGLQIDSKTVKIIGGRDVEASAKVTAVGQSQTLSYAAELLPLSSQRISEEVISVDGPLGKQDLPVELRRSILVTYLDDDILVVRDESGVPEVLSRQVDVSRTTAPPAPAVVAAPEPTSSTSTSTAPPVAAATVVTEGEDNGAEDPLSSDAS